jgi:hypothetical protein
MAPRLRKDQKICRQMTGVFYLMLAVKNHLRRYSSTSGRCRPGADHRASQSS